MSEFADALASFRAAADAAVDRGHRIAGEARAAGAAFQRESEVLATGAQSGYGHRGGADPHAGRGYGSSADPEAGRGHQGAEATAPDLRAAAAEFRAAQGLPVPGFADEFVDERPARKPPDDEDFSQFRIMRPL